MKASLAASMLTLLVLSGCDTLSALVSPVAAGVVTGTVLFNGQPAAGKRVSLTGAEKKATTDASGRYTFTGVSGSARLHVSYVSTFDAAGTEPPRREDPRFPSEVYLWQSAPFTLDGGGREVPAFDVAYNGLLYPDVGMSLIVSATSPVPFHWSPHPQARAYRTKVASFSTNEGVWTSEWASDPMSIFAKAVPPGSYEWTIEIDGGDRGTGLTRARKVDF